MTKRYLVRRPELVDLAMPPSIHAGARMLLLVDGERLELTVQESYGEGMFRCQLVPVDSPTLSTMSMTLHEDRIREVIAEAAAA